MVEWEEEAVPFNLTTSNLLEGANSRNLVARVNHRRCFPLRPHEDNIDELDRARHGLHLLEIVDGHGSS